MSLLSTQLRGRFIGIAAILLVFSLLQTAKADLSTLAKNDPYPVYKAVDPQEFLFTRDILRMKGIPQEIIYSQQFSIAFSAFGQNACVGKTGCGERVPLGDLNGRWSMLGLLMGPLPDGRTEFTPKLQEAFNHIFANSNVTPGNLNDPNIIDPARTFGFFSVPLEYFKRGLRVDFEFMLTCHLGFMLQAGVSDICQKVVGFDNLTCMPCPPRSALQSPIEDGTVAPVNCTPPNITAESFVIPIPNTTLNPPLNPIRCCGRICDPAIPCCGRLVPVTATSLTSPASAVCPDGDTTTKSCGQLSDLYPNLNNNNVNQWLMNNLRPIMEELGLDICNFHKVSLEDVRLNVFWRNAYLMNQGRAGWPEFMLIPFFVAGFSAPSGHAKRNNEMFGLPFGNNGHWSAGASGGLDIDFTETIQVGGEVGCTGFFPKHFCNYRMPNRVPTKLCQLAISPYCADVKINPGFNWTFSVKMLAYHFVDRLSVYAQYMLLHHEEDKICVLTPDPAFAPEILEAQSSFKVQMANIGFYYDISPSISLGVFIQAPLSQRNAYRSTTVMGSIWATY